MNNKIALCADSNCLKNPIDLGLEGERILDQTWILPFADALIARRYLREHRVAETWVVSSDRIDGINLAAALKKDNRHNSIRLFIPSPSGSKMSRCQNAGIVPICGSREFAQLYATKKLSNAQQQEASPPRERTTDPARTHAPNEPSSTVTVRRIKRNEDDPTGPLPTIDIEEVPMLTSIEDTSPALIPERKGFDGSNLLPATKHSAKPQSDALKAPKHTLSVSSEGASIITIVSGSGGTGKSSVAAISALLAQKRGVKTLLLDADFQFGDLKYLLGYKQTLDTSNILEHPEQIESLLKTDTWPALLAAPSQLEYSELMEEKIGELLAYLKPHFDLIVVNTGSSWSDLQIQLLEVSNNVFFILDQRPSSIRACNHALDLCSRCGIATTSFSYLLNFCSKKALLSSLDVSCALKGAKVFEIKDGGTEVSELLGAGMAHKLSRINNPFCASIEGLLTETVYGRIKPSLAPSEDTNPERPTSGEPKMKLRGRQKRRAACF